jgi:Domain of unknown function (DUF6899)
MPYVPTEARQRLDPHVEQLANAINALADEQEHESAFAGYLNYACTRLLLKVTPGPRYWSIATAVGVMKTVADEFYRRVGVPYEERMRAEHGDVYEQ